MKKLLIYGANFVDTIRLVRAINARKSAWEIAGIIDDNPELVNARICGYPVLGNNEYLKEYIARFPDIYVFNNVNPSIAIHKLIGERIDALQVRVPSLVHPDIDIEHVTIGKGVFIPHGCILGCDTVIGDYVTFRYGVTISHNVKIGNYAFIGPCSVCTGNTVIEPETYLGACSTVINQATIGRGSVVGASTLVNKNIRSGITVIGIPARELDKC
jgi:sugar O-acyltransferase (sialic acid O-acetyltransferase NeuD family)